ncbi:response regulator [Cytobacillus sp. Hz8]|uniref:response regulator n=1 Tax=Cytobacillus sp. Hz8 TaxID=3347168 RepID=UPI0035DB8602
MSVNIMVVDDHPVFRSGLKAILSNEDEFQIVGEAQSGEEAIIKVQEVQPDIIIMDINMPGIDGIEAAREIKKSYPKVKIIYLTMFSDEAFLKEGLNAGGQGYVLKKAVDTELISAIHTVENNEHYIYPTLVPYLYKTTKKYEEIKKESKEINLSEREKEVLKFIALGYTQKEIAEELFISIKTVETYKSRIVEKIGESKRSALVRYAIKHQLLSDL